MTVGGQVEGGGGLRRVLGPVDATCIVVGAIIGVGIFFTPSNVAKITGSGGLALLAWAIGGGIALLGALTFAELGGMYPRTGGQYQILRDAYGPQYGFPFVFCNATAIQPGAIAIIALFCAKSLAAAVGKDLDGGPALIVMAAVLIVGLALANVRGVRWGAGIQNATVFAKVATLLVVTGIAVFAAPEQVASDPIPETETPEVAFGVVGIIFAALVPAFFSFGGWQHALWISGEVRDPRRNVPLSIVGGVLLVVIVYMLVNWAYLALLGVRGVAESGTLASDAVAVVSPGLGPRLIAGAVAVSAFGVLNAQLLAGPRLVHGLAADGRFFACFAKVSPRWGTPVPAIALLATIALILLLVAGRDAVERLLTGVVFIDGVFFALTGVALLVLRRRRPEADRPVRVPLYPVVPILFVLGEFGLLAGVYAATENRSVLLLAVIWIATAATCYFVFFRRPRASGET